MYGYPKTNSPRLFTQGDLLEVLPARQRQIESEVNQLADDYIEKVDEKQLAASFLEKHILEVPEIIGHQSEWAQLEPESIKLPARESPYYDQLYSRLSQATMIDGQRITVLIPFKGNAELFRYKPRLISPLTPAGKIVDNEIELVFEGAPLNLAAMQKELTTTVGSIKEYLRWVANDVNQFNASIENIVLGTVSKRLLLKQQRNQLADNLGIPIRRRAKPPMVPPVIRKKIELPKVVRADEDPVLELAIYNHILIVCSDMTRIMEYSPKAFSKLDEEDLRFHFLVQLNGWYEGQATGETFNLAGKTDIILKAAGGNLFIAECKIWTGEKAFSEAIDQLLGYVSWRDTKTAIIVFNRKNKDFNEVLIKMESTIKAHQNFLQDLEPARQGQTERRYKFANKQDPSRHFLLSTLAFNVYSPS